MVKRFKDFILRTLLKTSDYIVGYDGMTGEEIRIKASDMVQKGEPGASADIQFSANADSWHFPAIEGDVYVRFRVGLGTWSVSRFVGKDVQGSGFPVGNPYDFLITDTESKPKWLKGLSEITPEKPELTIEEYAKKIVINYKLEANLTLTIGDIFQDLQDATIIIYNNRPKTLTVNISGIDHNPDYFNIEAETSIEITLTPYPIDDKLRVRVKINGTTQEKYLIMEPMILWTSWKGEPQSLFVKASPEVDWEIQT